MSCAPSVTMDSRAGISGMFQILPGPDDVPFPRIVLRASPRVRYRVSTASTPADLCRPLSARTRQHLHIAETRQGNLTECVRRCP